MDLTPEQQRQFAAHLHQVNACMTCPVCDNAGWVLRWNTLAIVRTCRRCGAVQRFDAQTAGLDVPEGTTDEMTAIARQVLHDASKPARRR